MAAQVDSKPRIPTIVGMFNPLARRMLGVGIPLGPNALITIRGRKTGVDRTTPVALVEIGGKRWVIGTFGETHWVRNLRAAGHATLTVGRRQEVVGATELGPNCCGRVLSRPRRPLRAADPDGRGQVDDRIVAGRQGHPRGSNWGRGAASGLRAARRVIGLI